MTHRLSAILLSDIVGYSRLMAGDEAGTLALLDEHNALVRDMIARHGGKLIKFIGDAAMAKFESAVDAVRCAAALQRFLAERNSQQPPHRKLVLRIGVAIGEIFEKDGDVFGHGVNLAARLQPHAEPGGVWVTDMVHGLARRSSDLRFEAMGNRRFKNIPDPVRVYRLVGVGSNAPSCPAPCAPHLSACACAFVAAAALAAVIVVKGGALLRAREAPRDHRYYIAVAPLNATSPGAAEQARAARTLIERRLEEELGGEPGIRVGGDEISQAPRTLDEAKAAARKAGASVVVWGDVLAAGGQLELQPYVTVLRGHAGPRDAGKEEREPSNPADQLTFMREKARDVGDVALMTAAHYFVDRDPQKAVALLRRVQPPCVQSLLDQSYAFALMQRFDDAEAAAKAAVTAGPKVARAHWALAHLRLRAGRFDEALTEAKAAAALDPEDADANRLLGKAYRSLGFYDKAVASMRKAVELAPESAVTRLDLAAVYEVAGRWSEELEPLSQAMTLAPDDQYPRLLYALALQRLGRADEAAAALAAVQKGDWPAPVARYLSGRLADDVLLADASVAATPEARGVQLCEAYFYVGMGHRLGLARSPSLDAARRYLALSADSPLHGLVYESLFASAELKRLELASAQAAR